MTHPLFSILVPVYNAGKYLDECLESLTRQSFSDYEVILIDDGSTDGSGENAMPGGSGSRNGSGWRIRRIRGSCRRGPRHSGRPGANIWSLRTRMTCCTPTR